MWGAIIALTFSSLCVFGGMLYFMRHAKSRPRHPCPVCGRESELEGLSYGLEGDTLRVEATFSCGEHNWSEGVLQ